VRKLIILPLAAAAIGVSAGAGAYANASSSPSSHTFKDKVQHALTQPGVDLNKALKEHGLKPTPPKSDPPPQVGSPSLPSSGPAVSSATVVAYMAGASYDVTSCSYDESFEGANYTAQSHGIELPSSTPWETFTCTGAHASYFVVYEQVGGQWTPTNQVQT
jgi:hypothetical protein